MTPGGRWVCGASGWATSPARAAPCGAVGPATVTATFFNFHPAMVGRAIPDAWASPRRSDVVEARRSGRPGPCDGSTRPSSRGPSLVRAARRGGPRGRRIRAGSFQRQPGARITGRSGGGAVAGLHLSPRAPWRRTCGRAHDERPGRVRGIGALRPVRRSSRRPVPRQPGLVRRGVGVGPAPARGTRPGRPRSDLGEGLELRRAIERSTDRAGRAPLPGPRGRGVRPSSTRGWRSVAGAVAARGEIPFPNPMGLPPPTDLTGGVRRRRPGERPQAAEPGDSPDRDRPLQGRRRPAGLRGSSRVVRRPRPTCRRRRR